MNSFDIIVLLLLTWGFVNGFRKGLIIEVSRFLALILGLWIAFIFSREASLFLANHIDTSPQILNGISLNAQELIQAGKYDDLMSAPKIAIARYCS